MCECEALRERLERAWDEGHRAGAEDAGRMVGWAYRTQQPSYEIESMPTDAGNPYDHAPHVWHTLENHSVTRAADPERSNR